MLEFLFNLLFDLIHLIAGIVLFCYMLLVIGLFALPIILIVVAIVSEILKAI